MTPTVEECKSLDADEFTDLVERPGTTAVIRWGDFEDPDATIGVIAVGEHELETGTRAERLGVKYTTTDPRTGESENYEYAIPLDYTEPNFGGVRPWFRCPRCGTRRGKLYIKPSGGRFRCRECHGLQYRSSRVSGTKLDEALWRYRKAFAKADAENRYAHPEGGPPFFPERPKGMHQDTFDDLIADVQEARAEWDSARLASLKQMLERLERKYDHDYDTLAALE